LRPPPFVPPRKGEGTRAEPGKYGVKNRVNGGHDVPVRESDNIKPLIVQVARSDLIVRRNLLMPMLIAIDLDDQP
jgi:hypothetical protein